MHLTIAICSWNRDRLLRQTLESLCALDPPADATWDIVVVDNNSTDETATVLRDFGGRLPLTSVFEPRPGVANARNRAVAEAVGDWIVWTDDDVIVDPGWLGRYAEAIRTWPDVVLFGGFSQLAFESDPPAWFREALPLIGGIFGDLPPLDGPIGLDDHRLPFTVNMAVRADVLQAHPFDARLGRREGQQLSHEDAEVVRTILEAGNRGRWVPDATVQHVVAVERQTEEYLRRWYEGLGQTMTLLEAEDGRPRTALWAWRQAFVHELAYRVTRLTSGPARWVPHLQHARIARGYLRGLRQR